MKLLVFAHTPPPFHGQSFMVAQMLEGFGGDRCPASPSVPHNPSDLFGIECHHVDATFSRGSDDVGAPRLGKLPLLFKWVRQAWRCSREHGVEALYYVPAPGRGTPVLRDFLVLQMLRRHFRRLIFHWHAAGLGEWLSSGRLGPLSPRVMRGYRDHSLSIVLSAFNQDDVRVFAPRRTIIVNNGIADPVGSGITELLEERRRRYRALAGLMERGEGDQQLRSGADANVVKLLFLGNLSRSKGLSDAIAAVESVNSVLQSRGVATKVLLLVGGAFPSAEERNVLLPQIQRAEGLGQVRQLGFVSGIEKLDALKSADAMLFPTFYENENQPVVLLEAMSTGLPVITSRWRSLPEFLPGGYPFLVEPKSVEEITSAILRLPAFAGHAALRQHFLSHFTLEAHLKSLSTAIKSVEIS